MRRPDGADHLRPSGSAPSVAEDKGWVRPAKGKLRALYSVEFKRDLGDFELLKTNEEEWTRPYISKDASRLFVGTRSGRIQALSASTGELLWQRRDMGTIGASIVEHPKCGAGRLGFGPRGARSVVG